MNKKKEKRSIDLTVGENTDVESLHIVGRAVVYDEPTVLFTVDGIEYKEVIAKDALKNADLSDVPLRYNHNDGFTILARTRNKSLRLTEDEKGLMIDADLAPTTAGKDVHTLIRNGYLDKMSFAFTVKTDSYDRETHTRTILEVDKLYDVSIVDVPAYDSTSVEARAIIEEFEKPEKERKRLLLLAQL